MLTPLPSRRFFAFTNHPLLNKLLKDVEQYVALVDTDDNVEPKESFINFQRYFVFLCLFV